jgi:two-component system nitrate/nitrite sensor histidine kinase NarX
MEIKLKFYLYFLFATILPILIVVGWQYHLALSIIAIILFIWLYLLVRRDFALPLDSIWQWINNYNSQNNTKHTSNSFSQVATAIDDLTKENQSLYDDMETVLNHQIKRLSKKTASLEILYNISEQLSQIRNKSELFNSFLPTLIKMSGASGGIAREVITKNNKEYLKITASLNNNFKADDLMGVNAPCLQASGVQFSVYNCPSCTTNPNHIGTIFIPLIYKNRSLGAFGLFFDSEPSLAYDERMLLQTIGDNVALHLERLNQIEKNKQHEIFKERLYISQDIHDSLAQTIYSMNIKVSMLKDLTNDENLLTSINKLEDNIIQANKDIRALIDNFRAGRVNSNEIKQIIDNFIADTKIKVYSQIETIDDSKTSKQLAMIISEALANIKKHAGAKNVRIMLGGGQLLIEDDGVGFDLENNTDEYHVGTSVMRERAERIGAKFYLESEKGSGTIIVVNYEL